MPRKRGNHRAVFSRNSIGAPSNCKKEFVGAVVAAVDGAVVTVLEGAVDVAVVAVLDGALVAALDGRAAGAFVTDALTAEVVGATDCVAVTGGADALATEVVGTTAGVAVVGTAGFATTGLAATAPATASLCPKTVEATHNGKTTTAKAQPKVWCCVAADFINGAL